MSRDRSGIGINFQFGSGEETPERDTPFRILVIGDFRGRHADGARPLRERKPIRVDRDNFDEVFARMNVGVDIPPLKLRFRELDDFLPDRLFDLEVFAALRGLRERLKDPKRFAQAAAELAGPRPQPPEPEPNPEPKPAGESEDLMDELLAQTEQRTPPASVLPGGQDWQAYLRQIVAPHVSPNIDEGQQARLLGAVDDTISETMRAVLHQPAFQAIESAWRGLHFLARRLETDEGVQLYILDATRSEIEDDLADADNLDNSHLYKVLVEQTVRVQGGQPWAVLAGLYTFGPERGDVLLLQKLGWLAEQAGAPFVAEASPQVVGCASFARTPDPRAWKGLQGEASQLWQAIQTCPEAPYLGLIAPRFLLRLPYGREAQTCERFDFEEMTSPPNHDDYLWGNPALACAVLLGETFVRRGWDFSQVFLEVDGLPLHTYEEAGERQVKPCAEALLIDRAAAELLNAGVMPLLSVQNRDSVRLSQLLSLAQPSRPLPMTR
jgi:type VI secretion system protein ImpC